VRVSDANRARREGRGGPTHGWSFVTPGEGIDAWASFESMTHGKNAASIFKLQGIHYE
jgi:hypothetical protein